jgi:hypothetical protein
MVTITVEAKAAAALHAASSFPGQFQNVDMLPNGDGKWTARLSEENLDFIFQHCGDESLSDAIVMCCIIDINEAGVGEARFQVCEKLRELYPVSEPRDWIGYLVQETQLEGEAEDAALPNAQRVIAAIESILKT